jgi:hypothetical protein
MIGLFFNAPADATFRPLQNWKASHACAKEGVMLTAMVRSVSLVVVAVAYLEGERRIVLKN